MCYLCKIGELLDTFFFVVRKKFHLISFLHVYHHAAMPVAMWFTVKYFGTGSSIYVVFCNSFVHTVMYTYYMIAAMGPEYRKYLWWKRYATILQLVRYSFYRFLKFILMVFLFSSNWVLTWYLHILTWCGSVITIQYLFMGLLLIYNSNGSCLWISTWRNMFSRPTRTKDKQVLLAKKKNKRLQ